MPALPNVPGVIQLNLGWKVDSDTTALTRHFLTYAGGAPPAANMNALCTAAAASAASNFAAVCHPQVGGATVTAVDLATSTGAEGTATNAWVGTRTGGALAPGTAVVASHAIVRRYRGGHSRSYLPFGTTTDLTTAGEWSAGAITAFASAWNAWANAVSTWGSGVGAVSLANVSYYSGFTVVINPMTHRARNVPTPRAAAVTNVFVSSTIRSKVGSQRRRNRKS